MALEVSFVFMKVLKELADTVKSSYKRVCVYQMSLASIKMVSLVSELKMLLWLQNILSMRIIIHLKT
jgi:hypothetical protein